MRKIMGQIGTWDVRWIPFRFRFRPFTFAGIIYKIPYGRCPDPAGIPIFRRSWITPGCHPISQGIRRRIAVRNVIVEVMQVLVIAFAPSPRGLPAQDELFEKLCQE